MTRTGGPYANDPSQGGISMHGPVVDPFLEAKLHQNAHRSGWLPRHRLLHRVQGAFEFPVTLVAAPAGYGKTVLLTQLLATSRIPTAWVSIDGGDNDPNRLWTHVGAALDRAGCAVDPAQACSDTVTDSNVPTSLLHVIVEALSSRSDDILLVVDDFHFIRDTNCHRQVEFLIEHLPPRAHLAIVTRSDPGLRLGRLRASGGLLEIRADELSFTFDEASAVLAREGVTLSENSISTLMDSTEGWPAGLYLASLSLAGKAEPDAYVQDFRGDNRYIGDYLTEEVLNDHPDEIREFIMRVSILDRFTAGLCDHVVGKSGSASILRNLERANLFVIPLDDEGRWYRFHHLFAAVARGELELTHPEIVDELHTRAAGWFSRVGNVDEAIRHSLAGADHETASALVQAHWLEYVDAGRIATVQNWLEPIAALGTATDSTARVTAAWMAGLTGDETTLTKMLDHLETNDDHGPLPDGSRSKESAVAMIQGLFGYGGPLQMMQGAERAVTLETDQHSPFHSLANVALGHAAYVMGDLERAIPALSDAGHNHRAPVIIRALSLATESLVRDELGDLERSRACAELAVDLLRSHGLRAAPQASLAYTALGRTMAASGRPNEALATLQRGLALQRSPSMLGPWATMHHLLVHARVAAEAGQTELAKQMLAQLDLRMARYSEGMLAMCARLDALRQFVGWGRSMPGTGERLTTRETEILRLLQGDMSLHEIASELFLSFNTVKTHSRAVYRKLGVHSRVEAVVSGRQQGLI